MLSLTEIEFGYPYVQDGFPVVRANLVVLIVGDLVAINIPSVRIPCHTRSEGI